jgi:probable addiction module antidote protein
MNPFDVVPFLDSEEMIAEYLNAAQENPDSDILLLALNDIARVRGMHNSAKRLHVSEARLNKVLKPGAKPRYTTIHRIMEALKPNEGNANHQINV